VKEKYQKQPQQNNDQGFIEVKITNKEKKQNNNKKSYKK
jgi:hypothetical protein